MRALVPNERQIDALREVTNIGCGRAVSALAQLVGGIKIQIDVPTVVQASIPDVLQLLGGAKSRVVAVGLSMQGAMTGKLLLILPEAGAHQLCSLLLGSPSDGLFQEAQHSAMGEVANIVASACFSAIGTLAGIHLVPSIPRLVQDRADFAVSSMLAFDSHSPRLLMACRFAAAVGNIAGHILVFPDESSIGQLLSRLGV